MALTPSSDVLEFMTRRVNLCSQKSLGPLGARIQQYSTSMVVRENDSDVIKWNIYEGGPANLYIRENKTTWSDNDNEDPQLMTLRLARAWMPLEFSGLEIFRGRLIGNEKHVANVIAIAQNNALFNIRRMIFDDHSEILASVVSTTGGAVSSATMDSVRWLKKGMQIDFYTAAGAAVSGGTGLKISAINETTKVITWTGGTPVLAATDEAYIAGNRNLGIYGVKAWINDGSAAPGTKGTTTIGGQSRSSTRPTLNALLERNGGTPRSLTFQLMDELVAKIYAKDSMADISAIYGGSGTVYAYKKLLQEKHYTSTPNAKYEYVYGNNKYPAYANDLLTPNEIPVISDPFLDEGILYFISEKDLGWHGDSRFSWIENPGWVEGKFMPLHNIPGNHKDAYAATMKAEFQITANPSRHGALVDITPEFYATS